ncbi:hypothetical protein SAMN05660691_03704 [Rheinheimera pacifica]|uniref:Uncharacterized protein n=1 Tax=Rheinheimera pacifica TaxID=173990 RepID=A0A1H6N6Z0_9GAMM|nr:hypothetical protein [Rheinheimera pacifica]SEI10475.1 hypothetical protein SAMN05660691_03704 [Rheinheimera pacifica]
MRIDAANNYLYTSQTGQVQNDAGQVVPGAGATEQTKAADFSSMTGQQLLAWANDKIKSGEMSLDDSRAFMAMTIKIPVNGASAGALQAIHSNERVDFMQKVRDGINGALERNDKETLKMLDTALSVMQKYQGQTIGVDIRV